MATSLEPTGPDKSTSRIAVQIEQFEELCSFVHNLNRERAIEPYLRNELTGNLKAIIQAGASDAVLLALAEKIVQKDTAMSKDLMYQIVKYFHDKTPELTSFISFDEESLYIKPNGILAINDVFSTKYPDTWESELISAHPIKELPNLVRIFKKEKEYFQAGCILYSSDPLDPHLTPIYMKKKHGRVHILVSDSRGNAKDPRGTEMFQELNESFSDITVCAMDNPRQADNFTCPVFCLLDLRACIETAEVFDLFDYLSQKNTLIELETPNTGMKLTTCQVLPPFMMKVTQSLTELAKYTIRSPSPNPDFPAVVVRRSSAPQLRFLNLDDLDKARRVSIRFANDGTKINHYVMRKWLNFVLHLLKSSCDNPLRPAISRQISLL